MKAKEELKPHEKFAEAIKAKGLKKTWVARQLEVSDGHLNNMLTGVNDLLDKHRVKLNEILSTNY